MARDVRKFRGFKRARAGVAQSFDPDVGMRRRDRLDRDLEQTKAETAADTIEDLIVSGDLSHTGTLLAFFGGALQTQAADYDQSAYATASGTVAAVTAAALTHGVGTADGTVDDVGAAHNQTTLNNNFRELTDQIAALRLDILSAKQNINALMDMDQRYSLVG